MTIALELLEAYLKCPTKCWLISKRGPISDSGHAQWVQARNQATLRLGSATAVGNTRCRVHNLTFCGHTENRKQASGAWLRMLLPGRNVWNLTFMR
jgi:hypothetical protein